MLIDWGRKLLKRLDDYQKGMLEIKAATLIPTKIMIDGIQGYEIIPMGQLYLKDTMTYRFDNESKPFLCNVINRLQEELHRKNEAIRMTINHTFYPDLEKKNEK